MAGDAGRGDADGRRVGAADGVYLDGAGSTAMDELVTEAPDNDLPFSEAIRHGDAIYVSGQGPLDPETGDVVGETAATQTDRTLDNVERILAAGGAGLDDIVNATLYFADMADYGAVNDAYRARLSEPYPARTAVEVSRHPVDILIEISVIAAAPD